MRLARGVSGCASSPSGCAQRSAASIAQFFFLLAWAAPYKLGMLAYG